MCSFEIFRELQVLLEENDAESFEDVLELKVLHETPGRRKILISELINLAKEIQLKVMIKNIFIVFINNLRRDDSNATEILQLFINEGVSVNDEIFHLKSLFWAVDAGNLDVVSFLIDHGADINQQEPYLGRTVLHTACAEKNADMVEILLKNGAEISIEDNNGKTAFSVLMLEL